MRERYFPFLGRAEKHNHNWEGSPSYNNIMEIARAQRREKEDCFWQNKKAVASGAMHFSEKKEEWGYLDGRRSERIK